MIKGINVNMNGVYNTAALRKTHHYGIPHTDIFSEHGKALKAAYERGREDYMLEIWERVKQLGSFNPQQAAEIIRRNGFPDAES